MREAADPLHDYIQASDAARAEAALEIVIARQAEPLIRKIVRAKLAFRQETDADADDVCSDALVSLIASADQHREKMRAGAGEPIADFDAFVAVIAYRACSDYFRRKYPEFHRLRNRLRYVLKSSPSLAIWQREDGEWLCGLERWRSQPAGPPPEEASCVAALRGSGADPDRLLAKFFKIAGGPVAFDNAARIVARCLDVVDRAEHVDVGSLPLADPAPLPDSAPERREWLARLWAEILELPPKQRTALLLNLRDEDGACATSVFIGAGVAGLAELAAAVALPLDDFAELWRRMPLEDLEIAERLGATRQQVINLRKCARERLARRIFPEKNAPVVIKRPG